VCVPSRGPRHSSGDFAASAVVVFGLWTCFLHFGLPIPWPLKTPSSSAFLIEAVSLAVFFAPCFLFLVVFGFFLRLFFVWCFDFYTLMLPLLLEWLCSILFLTIITFRSPTDASVRLSSFIWDRGYGLPRFLWWFGKQIGTDWFLFSAKQTRRAKEITLRVLAGLVENVASSIYEALKVSGSTFRETVCPAKWDFHSRDGRKTCDLGINQGLSGDQQNCIQSVIINDTFGC